ncbi:uncharacterized protein ACA1_301420, partial [Acanthamoeba castellanii str. Neff]
SCCWVQICVPASLLAISLDSKLTHSAPVSSDAFNPHVTQEVAHVHPLHKGFDDASEHSTLQFNRIEHVYRGIVCPSDIVLNTLVKVALDDHAQGGAQPLVLVEDPH